MYVKIKKGGDSMPPKWAKNAMRVAIVVVVLAVVSQMDTDMGLCYIGGIFSGIIGLPLLKGKWTLSSRGSTTPVDTPVSNSSKQKTGATNPLTWTSDKVAVPGYGYRDAQGNYYDYNGVPKPNPVEIKKK